MIDGFGVSKVTRTGDCWGKATHSMTRVVASVRHPMMSIVGVSKAFHDEHLWVNKACHDGCYRGKKSMPDECYWGQQTVGWGVNGQ